MNQPETMTTYLNVIARRYELDAHPDALGRLICFRGPGWYSLSDDGSYRRGRFATTSRIRIGKRTS